MNACSIIKYAHKYVSGTLRNSITAVRYLSISDVISRCRDRSRQRTGKLYMNRDYQGLIGLTSNMRDSRETLRANLSLLYFMTKMEMEGPQQQNKAVH